MLAFLTQTSLDQNPCENAKSLYAPSNFSDKSPSVRSDTHVMSDEMFSGGSSFGSTSCWKKKQNAEIKMSKTCNILPRKENSREDDGTQHSPLFLRTDYHALGHKISEISCLRVPILSTTAPICWPHIKHSGKMPAKNNLFYIWTTQK